MGRLLLIRHAKAADGAGDAARPLSDRGRRDASALGAWLREAPDHVVISPSRRTRETWELIAAVLGSAPEPVADDRVYDNTPELLLAVVREAPRDARTVAVVGHNPSIAELAVLLDDGTGDPDATTAVRDRFPPGAVAVFDVPTPFAELGAGGATLTGFRTPAG